MLAARHLNEEEIEQYSIGLIPDEASEEIEDHLLICEACQQRVSGHDVYLGAMRAAAAETRAKSGRGVTRFFRFPWLPWLVPVALAAAVFLVIGVMGSRLLPRQPVGPAVLVNLEAVRGSGAGSQAPAGHPLELHLDVAGLAQAPSRGEVVDSFGKSVWSGQSVASPGATTGLSVSPLSRGQYFVRLYSASGDLLREYGLEIEH